MKFCTLIKVADGKNAGIAAIDTVDDGHEFGLTADGRLCHVEGWVDDGQIWAGGMFRGSMTGLYAEPVPDGHPEGTPPAARR